MSEGRNSAPSPSLALNTSTNARRPSIADPSPTSTSSRSASFSLPTKDHPVRPGSRSSRSSSRSSSIPQSPGLLDPNNPNAGSGSGGLGATVPPPLPLGATQMNTAANAGEVFTDSEDEMTEEDKARHEEFQKKRKGHYSKEAAFALRAAKDMDEEEEDSEGAAGAGREGMEVDEVDVSGQEKEQPTQGLGLDLAEHKGMNGNS